MRSYAGAYYNLALFRLQSQLQHMYHGQLYARVEPFVRVDFSPQSGTKNFSTGFLVSSGKEVHFMSYLFLLFKDRSDYNTVHPIRLIYAKMLFPITWNFCVGNLISAIGARNQVGIGLSYRPASPCGLATLFQTRFLESIPRPIGGFKFSTLELGSHCT